METRVREFSKMLFPCPRPCPRQIRYSCPRFHFYDARVRSVSVDKGGQRCPRIGLSVRRTLNRFLLRKNKRFTKQIVTGGTNWPQFQCSPYRIIRFIKYIVSVIYYTYGCTIPVDIHYIRSQRQFQSQTNKSFDLWQFSKLHTGVFKPLCSVFNAFETYFWARSRKIL